MERNKPSVLFGEYLANKGIDRNPEAAQKDSGPMKNIGPE